MLTDPQQLPSLLPEDECPVMGSPGHLPAQPPTQPHIYSRHVLAHVGTYINTQAIAVMMIAGPVNLSRKAKKKV